MLKRKDFGKRGGTMNKRAYITAVIFICMITAVPRVYGTRPGIEKQDDPASIGSRYESVRIKKFPIAVQCWTFRKFSFFEALQKIKELGVAYVQPYPGQVLDKDDPKSRFDHNLSEEQMGRVKKKLEELGLSLVSYGVVGFGNDEEEMKKVFEFAQKMRIRTVVTEPGYDDYSLIEKMVRKYGVNVAIHNHPTPSKYARPETVIFRVDGLDPRIGACADTGHWMRSGVNPLEALRALKGRIQDVHLKDLNAFGDKEAYDVPFGQGKANIRDILAELTLQDYAGYLSIEHEKKEDVDNPSPAVRKGLEYIKSITYYQDHVQILQRNAWGYSKQGWNHYGPGYFELDEKTGVLKGQGGMGLLWYAVKGYKDFILELDYKCADENTNSGIFLRVPEMPASDDYIYHSFEIQINPAGKDIHKTGAVYDAEAPVKDAFYPPGEWNHFKISFIGNRIKIELNGELILDWEAEPRGKVRDFASEGYIGLQNHDSRSPVYFKNVYIKDLS
jgi:sugar phosphate isomerase/epimerase